MTVSKMPRDEAERHTTFFLTFGKTWLRMPKILAFRATGVYVTIPIEPHEVPLVQLLEQPPRLRDGALTFPPEDYPRLLGNECHGA